MDTSQEQATGETKHPTILKWSVCMGLDWQVSALLCIERSAILSNLLQLHDLMAGEGALHVRRWFLHLQLITFPISQMQFTISFKIAHQFLWLACWLLTEQQIMAHTNQQHKLVSSLLPLLRSGVDLPLSSWRSWPPFVSGNGHNGSSYTLIAGITGCIYTYHSIYV